MSNKVSFIVPTRNRRHLLQQALRSAAAQTWADTEIVLVDEASTDGSAEMVAAEFPRTRIIRNEQPRGPGGARNVGVAAADGDWVLFLDDDDLLHPEHVAALVRASLDAPPGCVVSGQWRRFVTVAREVRLGPVVCAPPSRSAMETLAEVLEPRGEGTIWTSSALWPRALCTKVQWDEQLYTNGDVDFFGSALLEGAQIVGRPVGMAYYRGHDGQRVAGSSTLRSLMSASRYRLKWSQLLRSHPEHEVCAPAMRNGFMALLIGLSGVPEAQELMPFLEDAYRLWGGRDYYVSNPPRHSLKRLVAQGVLKLGGPTALHWLLKQTSQPGRVLRTQLSAYHSPASDADKADAEAIRPFE